MNEKDIKSLKWEKDKEYSLSNGLFLRVRKSSKTYIIRKKKHGKRQIITLGKHPALSLRDAKYKAMQLAMKQDVTNVTVSELKEKYWHEVVERESKVPNQVFGYLNHIENEFGNKKVMDIKRAILVDFIQQYSSERGGRSADRLRSYLKQLFSYAVELGFIELSPMSEVTKRITGYKAIDRTRIISHDEIKMIWGWKNNKSGWQKTEDNVKVIKFLLLTGLRISEAQKGYIDGDLFRVDDTKGKHAKHEKRPHWVYLTDTAKELLPLPRCTETNIQAWLRRKLITEGYSDSKDPNIGEWIDKDGKSIRFTPHDCRRTFTTMANDAGVQPFITERCVNHVLEGMMAVYNHSEYKEERIQAFKAVEKAILKIIII